jgi:hypothetical protein
MKAKELQKEFPDRLFFKYRKVLRDSGRLTPKLKMSLKISHVGKVTRDGNDWIELSKGIFMPFNTVFYHTFLAISGLSKYQ